MAQTRRIAASGDENVFCCELILCVVCLFCFAVRFAVAVRVVGHRTILAFV